MKFDYVFGVLALVAAVVCLAFGNSVGCLACLVLSLNSRVSVLREEIRQLERRERQSVRRNHQGRAE